MRDRRVQLVRVLLEDQYNRKLRLREMGRFVSLSPWRLAHIFKSETGMSPQRYLTLVRLQRARLFLESGFLPVREIAACVGIPNPSQFTKCFKAAYGMTPMEYRKLHLRIDLDEAGAAIGSASPSSSSPGSNSPKGEGLDGRLNGSDLSNGSIYTKGQT